MQAFHIILMKKILITGASGFIGSFIVEEALRRGWDTWAAVRPTSSRRYLQDKRINFIQLNFDDEQSLYDQLSPHRFDYIVHSAGATKCLNKEDFFRSNTDGTKHLVCSINRLKMPLEKFIFISSLSIYGAIREQQPYTDIKESDTPCPNTAYGESKRRAEVFLTEHAAFPYIILRPTGVYGPREKDYFMMAKTIKNHIDFSVGFQPQDLTFVYVKDVVQAVFRSLESTKTARSYFLSDGNVYRSSTFSELLRNALGNPWWIRIKAPIWLLRIITFFGDIAGCISRNPTALNNDKFQILKQRNWRCDITPAIEELGYKPAYDLQRGVEEMFKWYKDNQWI